MPGTTLHRPFSSFVAPLATLVVLAAASRTGAATAMFDPSLSLAAQDTSYSVFGIAVDGGFDWNDDGVPDFAVGDTRSGQVASNAGAVFVYYGGAPADSAPDLVLGNGDGGGDFGQAIAHGDFDADGYDDLVVGAFRSGPGFEGIVHVYHGGPGADTTADWTAKGGESFGWFGWDLAVGDADRDGVLDLVVGAPEENGAGTRMGAAYYFEGGAAADTSADRVWNGPTNFGSFGLSVAMGDLNGDGYSDAIVGGPLTDDPATDAGLVFVYAGGFSGPGSAPDQDLYGADASGQLGYDVHTADVNGDGIDDLLAGRPFAGAGGSFSGEVQVHFGAPYLLAETADVALLGRTGNHIGGSISSAGDFDLDGFNDVIVGQAPAAGVEGMIRLFSGGEAMNGESDIVEHGSDGERLGYRLAAVGDIDGDGRVEVIAGGPEYDVGSDNRGRAHVFTPLWAELSMPVGGETWPVGARRTVSYRSAAAVEVRLSVDGGASYPYLIANGPAAAQTNDVEVRVPHVPTRFARLRVLHDGQAPSYPPNYADSDSFFTVDASVLLTAFSAEPAGGSRAAGVHLTWGSEPGLEDLSGYRLERRLTGDAWETLEPLVTANEYTHEAGRTDDEYRVWAVNGFGEQLLLGAASPPRARAHLTGAQPNPFNPRTTIHFVAPDDGAEIVLTVHDPSGRLVRSLVAGRFDAGPRSVSWDGRDDSGRPVASGVYLVRLSGGGAAEARKVVLTR